MNLGNHLYLVLFSIGLVCCNQPNEKESVKHIAEFYPNGAVSLTYTLTSDSVRMGPATTYYLNENVQSRYEYINGFIHGDVEFFDSITSRPIGKQIYFLDTLKYYELYDSKGAITYQFKYLQKEDVPDFDSTHVKLSTSEPFLVAGETVSMTIDVPGIPSSQITPSISNGTIWLEDEYQIRPGIPGECQLAFAIKIDDTTSKMFKVMNYNVVPKENNHNNER